VDTTVGPTGDVMASLRELDPSDHLSDELTI
jgi:hypothetical protein